MPLLVYTPHRVLGVRLSPFAGRLFSTKVQFHGTSAAKPAGDPTKAPPQKRHKTEGTKCPSLEQLSTQLGCVQHETKLVQEEYARKCKVWDRPM